MKPIFVAFIYFSLDYNLHAWGFLFYKIKIMTRKYDVCSIQTNSWKPSQRHGKKQRKDFMVLSTATYVSKYENESSYNFARFQLAQLVKFVFI